MPLALNSIGAMILASLVAFVTASTPGDHSASQKKNRTDEQRQAIAFLLGWDSKLVIVEKTRAGRRRYLSNITVESHELGLVFPHPIEFYFPHAMEDTERAQAFSEEAMAQLAKMDPEVANHFGAAHNFLLTLAHTEVPEATMREELEEWIAVMNIPGDLRRIPHKGLMDWAYEIHEYFASTAQGKTTPQS